jgi:murein DD-endopeptidase MepM/ murein hydrolase activator NlpD
MTRRTVHAIFCAALAAALPGPGAAALPQGLPVDVTVPMIPTPVESEGVRHLLYELHLTNLGREPLALKSLDVVDEPGGQALATYSGEALARLVARPGVAPPPKDRLTIGGGLRAVVFLDVALAASVAPPHRLAHRLTFEPAVTVNQQPETTLIAAEIRPATTRPVVLGPPLAGGCWIASHGLSNASSHRRTLLAVDGRATISQRFAIDWIRVGADGQAFRGDPARNANWTPYGAEVLAVADARVVATQDGVAENDPTADKKAVPITLATVGGNNVVLDLGGGRYAFYAHLQPGSLRVRPGEHVRRGQAIARLGNSGQSDAPHLHLQVTDGPSLVASEGLPLVFDAFDLQGHLPSLKVLTDGSGWRPTEAPQRRRREMPLENAVVRFGPGGC